MTTDHNSKNKIPSGDISPEVQSKEGTVSVNVNVSVNDDETFKTYLSNSSHLLADMNASPLHLHVTTVEGALLQGKPPVPSSIISHGNGRSSRSRSNSRTRARSRSRDAGHLDGSQSPSIVSGYGSASSSRRNSCSSIEDIEADILTDKMGHEELIPGSCASSVSTLHTVNERMSEDALEDCHAFTDLKDVIRQIQATHSGSGEGQGQGPHSIGTGTSSRNSVNGGSIMEDAGHLLETLEEFEEGEEDDEIEEDDNQNQPQDQPQAQSQAKDDDKNHVAAKKKEEEKQKLLLLKKKKTDRKSVV